MFIKNSVLKRVVAVIITMLMIGGVFGSNTVNAAQEQKAFADIVFVIDSTGSMRNEITSVKNGITDFVSNIVKAGVDTRIGILEYRDITYDGKDSTIIHTINGSPWHYSVADMVSTLESIGAGGGGDTPESLMDALGFITKGQMKFRSDARKFVIVLTDATYRSENRHGYKSMNEILSELQGQAITTSVITYSDYYDDSYGGGDSSWYYDATESISGDGVFGAEQFDPNLSDVSGKSDNPGYVRPDSSVTKGSPRISLNDKTSNTDILPGDHMAVIGDEGSQVFSFTPENTAIYTFASSGDEDTYGSLYDQSGAYLYSNDDCDGKNFRISALLEGGTTYHFEAGYCDEGERGEFPISLSYDGEAAHQCSYRELTEGTNGILADISGDFSAILFDMAQSILDIAFQSKKAIYILPGYLGSRLYDDDGNEVWVDSDYLQDDVKKYVIPFGEDTVLAQDSDGTGSKVYPSIYKDPYGAEDNYKNMVERFKESLGDKYDIVFFPYNWLGDLSEEEQRLEKHIRSHGYDKVVLVTHSTGGLLASNYISRSVDNKRRVEKAILIAAPLFGTYTSLQPIETGKTDDLDQMLISHGIEPGFLGIQHTVVHNWVKHVTKNSPTTYQLLPSEEYLKLIPAVVDWDENDCVTTSDGYYRMLNRSVNINSNLTNGNSRSHEFFRNNILGGNIVNVLKSVDTHLIGCNRGFDTPAFACYAKDFLGRVFLGDLINNKNGDGTVMGISAMALQDNRTPDGVPGLPYKNFPGTNHGDLASDREVIDYVCNLINPGDYDSSSETEDGYSDYTPGSGDSMSGYVKFNLNANTELLPKVYDPYGEEIDVTGVNKENTFYTTLVEEEGTYSSLLYLPSGGWKVSFVKDEENDDTPQGTIRVSLLDDDGFRTFSSEYSFNSADESGTAIAFDMSGTTVTSENIGKLVEGSNNPVESYNTSWEIERDIKFDSVGETATVTLSGDAVTGGDVHAGDLKWRSDDEDVVTVDDNGVLTATGHGEAVVTARQSGSNKVETCKVTVRKYATSVHIDNMEMETGERIPIIPTFDDDKVTEKHMDYTISGDGIIEIENDVVIALADGKVTVEATVAGGASTDFEVTVTTPKHVAAKSVDITPQFLDMEPGQSATFSASVKPEGVTNQEIDWIVEDKTVLEITSSDVSSCTVKALAPGKSKLYAVSVDGGYTGVADVTVYGVLKGDGVTMNSSFVYTGKEIKPTVSVKWDTKKLTKDKDYTVSYRNNQNAGNAEAVITGIGVFKGSVTKQFTINKASSRWSGATVINKKIGDKPFYIKSTVNSSKTGLTYKTSNKKVAVVNKSGKVTLKKIGSCYITISYPGSDNYLSSQQKIKLNINPLGQLKQASIKISNQKYTGKAIKPKLNVKIGSKTLKKGADYNATYSNNKKIGKAKVVVTGKGKYAGKKTVSFKIVPKGTSLSSVEGGNKEIRVSWKKQTKMTDGYQIQYSTSSKFTKKTSKTKTVKGSGETTAVINKLKDNKKYYVRIRTYKTVKGKKYYSAWSKAKKALTYE